MKKLFKRLSSRKGETLVESLASILIFTLASILLLTMVTSAANINRAVAKKEEELTKKQEQIESIKPSAQEVTVEITSDSGSFGSESVTVNIPNLSGLHTGG